MHYVDWCLLCNTPVSSCDNTRHTDNPPREEIANGTVWVFNKIDMRSADQEYARKTVKLACPSCQLKYGLDVYTPPDFAIRIMCPWCRVAYLLPFLEV